MVEILSNFDIMDLSKLLKIDLIACCSKSQLQNYKIKNGSFVINLDDNAGSHWVALYIRNNYACYFDPFAMKPPNSVIKYCENIDLVINRDTIQKINQQCCGWYCIAFLHYMTKQKNNNLGYNLMMFNEPFDLDNTSNNDNILQEYFRKL